MSHPETPPRIAIIGGGPAGLMAAEAASGGDAVVHVYDAMASCGRKFLLAGKGGLNLTHRDRGRDLLAHYRHCDRPHTARPESAAAGEQANELDTGLATALTGALSAFDGDAIRNWASELGIESFIGSSGRVFPADMKAAPLLRAWLRRLRASAVHFHARHHFLGWDLEGGLRFATPQGERRLLADATVLALGGASWPRLGSDGQWVAALRELGVEIAALRAANCGFECPWSAFMRERYAGAALKSVALEVTTPSGEKLRRLGEFVLSEYGVEGSLIYALSAHLRESLAATGVASATLDLAPGRELATLARELARPRGKHTLAHHLKRRAGIAGVKLALLHELLPAEVFADPLDLAAAIKAVPLRLVGIRPLAEAISTAGGVSFRALDEHYMLHRRPGVFVAGEMLDWEAPTGGYLLTACLATGRAAGAAALGWACATGKQP